MLKQTGNCAQEVTFIRSYSFNRQVDITQLQTDWEKAITLYSG